MSKSLVYDAAAMSHILGLRCHCNDPVPEPADGEIVIYYGGWDLPTLRDSAAGQTRMGTDQDWFDSKAWKAEPGYYRLTLRIPNSDHKSWGEQVAHLRTIDETAQCAPIAVAALALLVHLKATGKDLLGGDWCRCAESLPDGRHATVTVYGGLVYVSFDWDDARADYLWLSASRKV